MDAGGLELVRGFVNTRDIEAGTDSLATPAELSGWLRQRGLAETGVTVSHGDLIRATELREAVRELLVAHHDGVAADDDPVLEGAAQVLTAAAARARLGCEFRPVGEFQLVISAAGVNGALGALLVVVAEAMADGSWRRLKVCRNGSCQWAFIDSSRSGAGKWCSMAICGNRQKARAWRARQRN